jgi:bromodomain-containing factor 1
MDEPLLRKCDALMKNLAKKSQAVHFLRPVDWKKMGLHDYPKLIKHPMDLGTVSERLNKNAYARLEDFANETRLVWVRPPLPRHGARS